MPFIPHWSHLNRSHLLSPLSSGALQGSGHMIRLSHHPPLHFSYHLTNSQRVTAAHCGPVLTHAALSINMHTHTGETDTESTWDITNVFLEAFGFPFVGGSEGHICFIFCFPFTNTHSPGSCTSPWFRLAWRRWILAAEACRHTRRTGEPNSVPSSTAPEPRGRLQAQARVGTGGRCMWQKPSPEIITDKVVSVCRCYMLSRLHWCQTGPCSSLRPSAWWWLWSSWWRRARAVLPPGGRCLTPGYHHIQCWSSLLPLLGTWMPSRSWLTAVI